MNETQQGKQLWVLVLGTCALASTRDYLQHSFHFRPPTNCIHCIHTIHGWSEAKPAPKPKNRKTEYSRVHRFPALMGTLNPPSRKICQVFFTNVTKSGSHYLIIKIFPDCLDHFKLEGDLLRALHMTEVSQLKAMLYF